MKTKVQHMFLVKVVVQAYEIIHLTIRKILSDKV